MTTRDGVRLDADVYWPPGMGPFPVLLMRQPYGRAIASTVVYAHPSWYAAHGYIVVIQDVRGRGTSEGQFDLFAHEVEDGYDTVQWAADLPGSSGQVGMYGFSYQGMTQLYAAQGAPPALVTLAPAMVGYHPYEDWAYENGALVLQAGVGWALQLGAETARRRRDAPAYQALRQAARQGTGGEVNPANPEVLRHHDPDSFWHQWLAHPQADDYWQGLTPDLSQIDLPMLHVGGWFDPYLRGDLRLYQEMVGRSRHPQPLWIGPWGHLPWGRYLGDRDFGPAAHSPIDQVQIAWFDQQLKGQVREEHQPSSVYLFAMGPNQWQRYPQWPQVSLDSWGFLSTGLAALQPQAGQLLPPTTPSHPSPGWEGIAPDTAPDRVDVIVHDPWRPVPALGGHGASPPGPYERSRLEDRSDIVTYTSEPLTEPLTLLGTPQVTLLCQADTPSFDLSGVLSEVWPDDRVYSLTQGYGRFDQTPGQFHPCTLSLHPTHITIAPGYRLRLSLSGACFPAYGVNPGHGAYPQTSTLMDSQIITIAIAANTRRSHLLLPVLSQDSPSG